MSFWNGAFAKHRDYQHATFYEHLLANGVISYVCPLPVWCDIDPITDEELERSKRYYILFLSMSNKFYPYLIPEHQGGGEPDDEDVRVALTKYLKWRVDRGRDINNYIDFERGINERVIADMRSHGLDDKIDFRWTDNMVLTRAS